MKTYLVQTWDEKGAKNNHYETQIASTAELAHLKKFLRKHHAHVTLTEKPKPKPVGAKRKR